MLAVLKALSEEKNKPFAVTEAGLEQITVPDWWTSVVLPVMGNSGATYFLVWRNGYDKHYYAPYGGHPSVRDFRAMVRSG
ncbi:MAG: beta-mannosidase, partial [Leadbetterella sp.]|nr:beta-mannosidase [Leadbetterella sp.]